MANKSRLQGTAERVVARYAGVDVADVRKILADETGDERLVGRVGFDWWVLVLAVMQVLMEQIGNCSARQSVFESMRKPTPLARTVMRHRARQIFKELPRNERMWGNIGATVARSIEAEAVEMDDEEMATIFTEVQNPPIDLMLI